MSRDNRNQAEEKHRIGDILCFSSFCFQNHDFISGRSAPGRGSDMNIRKNIDYSEMYVGIDQAIAADLSQMELYLALGRLVSDRPEKGAAVMAAEYISTNYPDQTGFSPRNLRRMRDIFRLYEGRPEMLELAVKIGWMQNLTIMEADLDLDARYWYLLAVQRFGWSKAELTKQIAANAHMETTIREEAQDYKNVNISKNHHKVKKPS